MRSLVLRFGRLIPGITLMVSPASSWSSIYQTPTPALSAVNRCGHPAQSNAVFVTLTGIDPPRGQPRSAGTLLVNHLRFVQNGWDCRRGTTPLSAATSQIPLAQSAGHASTPLASVPLPS